MFNARTALKIILVVGVCGVLFSGYLTYQELFTLGCTSGCSSLATNNLFGIPVCVFGFVMYAVIVIVTILGLLTKKDNKIAQV